MRILIAAAFIALLAVAADAQGAGTRKGASEKSEARKEDLAKKKADEQAYKDALKQIPEAKEKSDPWKTMR